MEDEQLRKIAQLLVKSVIEKAVDQVKTENKEMDEGLDQGVDDIVGLTIGRSVTAIRGGQCSPTDHKMKGLVGDFDKEIEEIVELTIGRSITAIRGGQSSPAEEMLKLNIPLVTTTPEVTTGSTGSETPDCEKGNRSDHQPHIVTSEAVKDNNLTRLKKERDTAHQTSKASGKKTSADKTSDGKTAGGKTSGGKTSGKKTVLERLLDRILGRDKKEANDIGAATDDGSTNPSVGRKKKSSAKAHNKRDWIRRNLLCCFVRQTATVEPILD